MEGGGRVIYGPPGAGSGRVMHNDGGVIGSGVIGSDVIGGRNSH